MNVDIDNDQRLINFYLRHSNTAKAWPNDAREAISLEDIRIFIEVYL